MIRVLIGKIQLISSIFQVLQHTSTKLIGQRLLMSWISQPLLSISLILERQTLVQYFLNNQEKRENIINFCLKGIPDLEKLSIKLENKKNIKPMDLYQLYTSIGNIHTLLVNTIIIKEFF